MRGIALKAPYDNRPRLFHFSTTHISTTHTASSFSRASRWPFFSSACLFHAEYSLLGATRPGEREYSGACRSITGGALAHVELFRICRTQLHQRSEWQEAAW